MINIHKELEAWRARDPNSRAYDIDLSPGDNFIELRAIYGLDYLELTFTGEVSLTWDQQVEILSEMLKEALMLESQWRTSQVFEALGQSAALMANDMLKTFGQDSNQSYIPYARQLAKG